MLRVDWSKLPTELLEVIVKRLSFYDKFSFKQVCSSWRFAVLNLSLISSFTQFPKLDQLPLLMLPTDNLVQDTNDCDDNDKGCCFYSLDDQKFSGEYTNMWGDQGSRCIGSSKGWLILVWTENSESSLYIFNPFYITAKKIVLPSYKSPPNFAISRIVKSVLASNPIGGGDKYGVVFLYGHDSYRISMLMYDVHNHKNKWIDLQLKDGSYADVICNQDSLFALCDCFEIEVWDLGSVRDGSEIKKVKHIQISSPKFGHRFELFNQRYTVKTYLVEKEDNFLLVMRCIGEVVKEDGEVVDEGALLDDPVYSHLDASYMTKNIYVYKLDTDEKKWLKLDSLGNQALFLGVNESLSLLTTHECQRNSIYFTDDYWDHIYMYDCETLVGHDMGVFSLKDKSIKQIFPGELRQIVPPPVWVDQTTYWDS